MKAEYGNYWSAHLSTHRLFTRETYQRGTKPNRGALNRIHHTRV